MILLNFFLYAEDPVAHSETESRIPILGNVFSMILTKYPANLYSALKVFMWLFGMCLGMVLGKFFWHQWLFRKLVYGYLSTYRPTDKPLSRRCEDAFS